MQRRVSIVTSALMLVGSACTGVFAEKPHGATIKRGPGVPVGAVAPAPPVAPSPYKVELVDEEGHELPTFSLKGRFYVLGSVGQRYGVRMSNPSDKRVEAVLSIDGLDALDGESADFKSKRGYVIPAYQSITVEGFRVSMDDVAAFRFSSVSGSYAAGKGKDRHVGVVGVAFFPERYVAPVMIPEPVEPDPCNMCGEDDRAPSADESGGPRPTVSRPMPNKSPDVRSATRGDAPRTGNMKTTASGGRTASPPPTAPSGGQGSADGAMRRPADKDDCCGEREEIARKERPGLGTEYGERRSAPVIRVSFERESSNPCCVVSMRYNDRAGLIALGFKLDPEVDQEEVWTRETANPFPDTPGFSAPPAGWSR